jgi:hypothetical protein
VEYFLSFPVTCSTNNTVLKITHPTSEVVVSYNGNYEQHFIRAIADTSASCSITLENNTSENLIRNDERNKSAWSTMDAQFTTNKYGLVTFSLPEFNLKKETS